MGSDKQFVGNYRMFHLIRAGSIYEIWAVRPMSETTPFAMKWLPPGNRHTREAVIDLKHEFEVGSTLDHDSVIKTYEYGADKNGSFMVLELFKVPNFKQKIITNHRHLHHAASSILEQAAKGLAHMHERGWVHRDVKPDNFLVSDDNIVKLIDFNLSRRIAGMLGKIFSRKEKVQGTYSYIAPEQIRGAKADPSADIYSLGCVAFELFSGKPPFTANTPNELLQKHLTTKAPKLTVVDKNITPEFSDFVERMMAKNPADRPSTMKDVQMEFRGQKIFYQTPDPPSLEPADEEAES